MSMAKGDIIFFADDDAVYLDGYTKAILEVYQADPKGMIGGVQGTIINIKSAQYVRWGLGKIFLLTRFDGHGSLQSSAWPAYYGDCLNLAQVEVFSGPSMSFRKEVLQKFQFDKALAKYWMGDDFEMAYRVSRKYRLFQAPNARLQHYSSPVDRDSIRQQIMMMVVNHYYLTKKFFGLRWKSWISWVWSEIGLWLLALLWIITGKGPTRFLGMLDGYRELFRSIVSRS
jgi:GT2 family glycosyltransferase